MSTSLYKYDVNIALRFDPTLTTKAIQGNPFDRDDRFNPTAIAQWVKDVVPAGTKGYRQSADVTCRILNELYEVSYSKITEALNSTGYDWDFSDVPDSYALKRRLYDATNTSNKEQDTMGEASQGDSDIGLAKLKIEQLEGEYNANTTNPGKLKQIIEMVIAILTHTGDSYGKTLKNKDKIAQLQEALLVNARSIRGNIYQMSRAELARIRMRPPAPGGVRVVVPPVRLRTR